MKKTFIVFASLSVIALAVGGCTAVAPAPIAAKQEPVFSSTAQFAAVTPPVPHPDASLPTPKKDKGRFLELHAKFLARGKSGPIGLLFLGDSITEFWSKAPDIFKESYGTYQPANFGISGDTTQGVLWRIANGELDGIHPKVLVYMLGTNNAGSNTAEEIFAAERKIISEIRAKLPDTKILLLAIFPRGPRDTQDAKIRRAMAVNADVNHGLATLDDGKMIRYLDIGPNFLDANGNIPAENMPDQLHPSRAGYKIWADSMKPVLTEMLGQ